MAGSTGEQTGAERWIATAFTAATDARYPSQQTDSAKACPGGISGAFDVRHRQWVNSRSRKQMSTGGEMEIPKDGLRLHKSNFNAIGQQLQPLLESGECYRLTIKPWRDKRSLSQNALSHMWYAEISAFLIRRGKPFASPEWVKDAMKHTYLGYEEREMVDVVTGDKTTIRSLRHTSDLDTGDMHFYLTQVEGWALNIGCSLTVPADSEYAKLRDKQNQ